MCAENKPGQDANEADEEKAFTEENVEVGIIGNRSGHFTPEEDKSKKAAVWNTNRARGPPISGLLFMSEIDLTSATAYSYN